MNETKLSNTDGSVFGERIRNIPIEMNEKLPDK